MDKKNNFSFLYELKQTASDEAEILLYSEIVSYKWRPDDPEMTAAEFDKLLKEAKKNGATKLRLRINCPGGSVWQAVAMKTQIMLAGFEEVNIDIEGLCASAATFFPCIPGANVRIAEGSSFMIHNPYTSVWGGTAKDFRATADRLEKMQDDQHTMYARRSGQTEEQIKQWMDDETWFTAAEAVEKGFADSVIDGLNAAACVREEDMELMQSIYSHVPAGIKPMEAPPAAEETNVSNAAGDGDAENKNSHKEETVNMEIKDVTAQQLMAENPELYNEIHAAGVNAERERQQQITELTDEGFETLAQTAKDNGTSAADFLKEVVKARAQKKKDHLAQRRDETAPAEKVAAGAHTDNDKANEAEEIKQYAKEIAEMAGSVNASNAAMY